MSSAPLSQVTDWSDIVKISVGSEEQPFAVHKHVLNTIPFFRACLSSPFQESITKTVQMPEDDVKAFTEIIEYAYSGHLSSNLTLTPISVNLDGIGLVRLARQNEVNLCLGLKVYTLGHKLGMEELPNKIMDVIDQFKRKHPGPSTEELVYIFETAQVKSIPRTYLLQYFACYTRWLGWNTWKSIASTNYERFFKNIVSNVEEVLQVMTQPMLVAPCLETETDPCKWHVHVCSSSTESKCPSPKARDAMEEGIKALSELGETMFLQSRS